MRLAFIITFCKKAGEKQLTKSNVDRFFNAFRECMIFVRIKHEQI